MHDREPRAGRLPATRPPGILSFVGPFVDSQPMGTGIIRAVGVVAAGATKVIAHQLGRVPVYSLVLANAVAAGFPTAFPGDCYITTADQNNATVRFENAQTAASFVFIT